jgi:hypothetical protein
MATMKVEDSLSGADVDVELPPAPGRAAAAASRPVALSTEDLASLDAVKTAVEGTLTVSGTVTANLGATDNAVLDAIEVDTTTIAGAVSGTEMQVDVVTSALPTGAATAAKQPALGTAGTASTDVISVQGIASMTALVVDGSGVTQPVSGTVTANLSATDNAVLDAIEVDTTTIAGAVSGTEMQVDVIAALPAGTNAIGKLAANSGVDIGDVDVLSVPADPFGANADAVVAAGAAGSMQAKLRRLTTDLDSALTAIASLETEQAATTAAVAAVETAIDGATLELPQPYKNLDVDESEDQVKATAAKLFFINAMNMSASVRYLKIYNATAATVIVGTTVPDFTFPLPTMGDTNGAGFVLQSTSGIEFTTALTIAATTGLADNDTGAPSANEVIVNLGYR